MQWLNLLALAAFALIQLLALRVSHGPAAQRRRIVRTLCWVLLAGNLARYLIVYPFFGGGARLPAEFSTVAYFAVPAILLAGCETLESWAAYAGLMAGFFYYAAMILAGGTIYGADPLRNTCISLFCHGTLYFCGFVTASARHYPRRELGKLLAGVGLVALRAAAMRPLVAGSGRMLIYILLDAVPVQALCPDGALPAALAVYYVLLAVFVVLTAEWFIYRSGRFPRRRAAYRAAVCGA